MVILCVRRAWRCAALSARLWNKDEDASGGEICRVFLQNIGVCGAVSRREYGRARQAADAALCQRQTTQLVLVFIGYTVFCWNFLFQEPAVLTNFMFINLKHIYGGFCHFVCLVFFREFYDQEHIFQTLATQKIKSLF